MGSNQKGSGEGGRRTYVITHRRLHLLGYECKGHILLLFHLAGLQIGQRWKRWISRFHHGQICLSD
jgi:hypothetical protein